MEKLSHSGLRSPFGKDNISRHALCGNSKARDYCCNVKLYFFHKRTTKMHILTDIYSKDTLNACCCFLYNTSIAIVVSSYRFELRDVTRDVYSE